MAEEVVVVTVEEEAATEITLVETTELTLVETTELTLVETTVLETVVKLGITPSALEFTAPACHLC